MLWEVDLHPAPGQPDLAADQVAADAAQGNQQLQQAVQEAEARAVRAQAELENFRKRMRRDFGDSP